MPRVAGVTTQKNERGELTHVTFSMKKHGEALSPLLNKLGVVEKTPFQKECDRAISLEEFQGKMTKRLDKIWPK